MAWPTNGSVTSGFGYRWGSLHAGIDIANGTGTPIRAAKAGTIILAGWNGGYGNCIGVPTVGGEIRFAEPHSANPTVDVMCVGLARAEELVTATSLTPHVGSLMVLYGATTGRDGIGGVSVLASATPAV